MSAGAPYPRPERDPVAEQDLADHIAEQPAHGGDLAGTARPPTPHGHPVADVTGLQTALDAKASAAALADHVDDQPAHGGDLAGTARPPTAHGHPISDITTLQASLDGKADDADVTAEATARATADTAEATARAAHAAQTTAAHGGIVASGDPRLTDARTPTAHKATHATGGSDALAAADIGAEAAANKGAASGYMGLDAASRGAQSPKLHASTHVRGASDALAALDGYYQPRVPRLVVPAVADTFVPTSTTALAVNQLRVVRAVIPETGNLRDLTFWVGAQSGNIIAVVYDTGDASAGNRTRLYASASTAVGAVGWQTIDPNLPVVAGQQVDIGLIVDNATAQFGRYTNAIAAGAVQLPSGFGVAAGGAPPKLAASFNLGSFAAPATIAEASLSTTTIILSVIARIS